MSTKNSSRLTQAAYQTIPGGPLDVDKEFYDRIGKTAKRELVNSFILPIRSGKAWKVNKGQICKITTIEGPQVADLNIWNAYNPRERMWAARTRQLQRAHVSVYDRLWSTLPYLRPLCTIVGDSLSTYGKDEEGGRVHDLLGTRCDPYVNKLLTGKDFDYHCHSNLTRAILPFGLHESDVHDVLNVFQSTGLNENDQYFMKSCPAKKGDYFEFFAEQDLLVALSTCPGGDLSKPMWGEDVKSDEDESLECCRPLGIEIFNLPKEVLHSWTSPEPNGIAYKGGHGLREQVWQ